MQKPKTIKTFLKTFIMLKDLPLSYLNGYENLSETEQYLIGALTAEVANLLGESEFEELLEKLKIKNGRP